MPPVHQASGQTLLMCSLHWSAWTQFSEEETGLSRRMAMLGVELRSGPLLKAKGTWLCLRMSKKTVVTSRRLMATRMMMTFCILGGRRRVKHCPSHHAQLAPHPSCLMDRQGDSGRWGSSGHGVHLLGSVFPGHCIRGPFPYHWVFLTLTPFHGGPSP